MEDRQKTVLVYAPYIGNGGVRRFAMRLVNTWIKTADPKLWRFRVLSQPVDGNGDPLPWADGVFSPVAGDLIRENLGARLCDFLQSNQDMFWKELKKQSAGADIVWLPQPWWTLRMTEGIVDIPAHIIPTVHDFAFDELQWDGLFGDRFRDETRNFVSVSHTMIYSSEFTARRAAERYGMPSSKGKVIYLADFVPESFNPTEEEATRVAAHYGLPSRYWLAFHAVGHKDPLTIFEGLVRSKRSHGSDFVPLVIAGVNTQLMLPESNATDPTSTKVKACIEQNGLVHGRDYFILGFIPDDDIAGLYRGAYGCIVASKSEAGFSASIFEAQRAKTPLIHSDIQPFVERLGAENEYGIRFKCGDPQELYVAMDWTIRHPELAKKKADDAFRTFCHRTWEDVAKEYLHVFEAACKEGPSKRVWKPSANSIQKSPVSATGEVIQPKKTVSYRLKRLLQKVRRKVGLDKVR